jgi:sugar lactone lactonase YvrE
VTMVDISSRPYKVISTEVTHGLSEGLRFSPDGKFLAACSQNGSMESYLSSNHHDHASLAIFAVDGGRLRRVQEIPVGGWAQGVAFSRDGHTVLVQSMMERAISVFGFSDGKLTPQEPIAIPNAGPAMIGTARP